MDAGQAGAGLVPYSIYHECSLNREYSEGHRRDTAPWKARMLFLVSPRIQPQKIMLYIQRVLSDLEMRVQNMLAGDRCSLPTQCRAQTNKRTESWQRVCTTQMLTPPLGVIATSRNKDCSHSQLLVPPSDIMKGNGSTPDTGYTIHSSPSSGKWADSAASSITHSKPGEVDHHHKNFKAKTT